MMAATMEMSKTYQYRKVMKPMLERKRRARINKCLDELKDLMVATLESEGEHITRLEKADILELTVSHLQKLRQQKKLNCNNNNNNNNLQLKSNNGNITQAEGFRSGFIFAANEVSRNLAKIPGVNITFGTQLMTHLGQRLNQIQPAIKTPIPIHHPITIRCGNNNDINNIESTYGLSTLSSSSSPRSIYSVPMSPISNYSESPQTIISSSIEDGLLLKQTSSSSSSDLLCANGQNYDNVWRPW